MYHFEIIFWNSLQTERAVFSSLSFCTCQGFRLFQTEHFLQRFLRREPDLKQFLPFKLAPSPAISCSVFLVFSNGETLSSASEVRKTAEER